MNVRDFLWEREYEYMCACGVCACLRALSFSASTSIPKQTRLRFQQAPRPQGRGDCKIWGSRFRGSRQRAIERQTVCVTGRVTKQLFVLCVCVCACACVREEKSCGCPPLIRQHDADVHLSYGSTSCCRMSAYTRRGAPTSQRQCDRHFQLSVVFT